MIQGRDCYTTLQNHFEQGQPITPNQHAGLWSWSYQAFGVVSGWKSHLRRATDSILSPPCGRRESVLHASLLGTCSPLRSHLWTRLSFGCFRMRDHAPNRMTSLFEISLSVFLARQACILIHIPLFRGCLHFCNI